MLWLAVIRCVTSSYVSGRHADKSHSIPEVSYSLIVTGLSAPELSKIRAAGCTVIGGGVSQEEARATGIRLRANASLLRTKLGSAVRVSSTRIPQYLNPTPNASRFACRQHCLIASSFMSSTGSRSYPSTVSLELRTYPQVAPSITLSRFTDHASISPCTTDAGFITSNVCLSFSDP